MKLALSAAWPSEVAGMVPSSCPDTLSARSRQNSRRVSTPV